MVQNLIEDSSFPVPRSALAHLYQANRVQLQVLLWMLGARRRHPLSEEDCQALGISRAQFLEAASFWQENGVLPRPQVQDEPALQSQCPGYTVVQIAAVIEENRLLREMITRCEQLLAKPLSTADVSTLYGFYDWLGLAPDVIELLVENCAHSGKTGLKYIEKIAIDWSREGLCELSAAKKHLDRQQQQSDYLSRIRSLFSLQDRPLSPTERKLVLAWQQAGYSDELLLAAFDRTLLNTGKVAFPYLNSILEAWQQKGVTAPEQVGQKDRPKQAPARRYDYDELARLNRTHAKKQVKSAAK